MRKKVITYDVFELDLFDLKRKIEALNLSEVIVYGIGNNGNKTYKLLKRLDINVKCFVDVKANQEVKTFKGKSVISPKEYIDKFRDELIIITPSIHEGIVSWLKRNGVSEDEMITSFYQTEKVSIDYGEGYEEIGINEDNLCKTKPQNVKATFVTIAYNTPENLFRRAIESVLNQTQKNLKYLIIINGATDNSLIIAKEYAELDARIEIIDLEENLPWTNPKLLKTIRDNIEGKYCCQLDSDDYYDVHFLEETVGIAESNNADIVCARTCLFAADYEFNPLTEGLVYDWHDKFYFNIVHPNSHYIGHKNIMTAYAKSKICSTFWGKIYANDLMIDYLNYQIELPSYERETYYRLDITMTYRILYMAGRVFYSDKILHFSQFSKKNSTFTLAPIEWLMALWYSYKGVKSECDLYYSKKKSKKYAKGFLRIHLLWMVGRKGMLNNPEEWKNKELIFDNMREMIDDEYFSKILNKKNEYMKKDREDFYNKVCEFAKGELYGI